MQPEQNNSEIPQKEQTPIAPVTAPVPVEAVKQEESEQERNWKKFRESKEAERKRADEATARAMQKEAEALALKKAMEALVSKPEPTQTEYEEESEQARIDRRVEEILAKKEREYEQKLREQEAKEWPIYCRRMHADFDQVCNSNNMDYLEYHHPELYKSFARLPDTVEKWNDIYGAIKRYIPNPQPQNEMKKAEANLKRPQAFNSVNPPSGLTPPATRLTEERKNANWLRMQGVMNKID
jgi:hypothetical protein